jgi:hypothetical protein
MEGVFVAALLAKVDRLCTPYAMVQGGHISGLLKAHYFLGQSYPGEERMGRITRDIRLLFRAKNRTERRLLTRGTFSIRYSIGLTLEAANYTPRKAAASMIIKLLAENIIDKGLSRPQIMLVRQLTSAEVCRFGDPDLESRWRGSIFSAPLVACWNPLTALAF